MTAIQLNAELYRAMGEIADNEKLLAKVLTYVKSLVPAKKTKTETTTEKPYKVIPVSPEIKKWSGCASFSEEEIDNDPRLKALLSHTN